MNEKAVQGLLTKIINLEKIYFIWEYGNTYMDQNKKIKK